MNTNIETSTAKALLEEPQDFIVAGKRLKFRPLTLATLIKISSLTASLPALRIEEEKPLASIIQNADSLSLIAEILAFFVYPYKRKSFFSEALGRFRRKRLALFFINNLSASEMQEIFLRAIKEMNVADFFALTTFLKELNLTKPTKVVESQTEATAFGL